MISESVVLVDGGIASLETALEGEALPTRVSGLSVRFRKGKRNSENTYAGTVLLIGVSLFDEKRINVAPIVTPLTIASMSSVAKHCPLQNSLDVSRGCWTNLVFKKTG